MKKMNILIVEDESIVALEIESYLIKLGHNVVDICSNGKDALNAAKTKKIELVMMDICLKGEMDGIETAALIKQHAPNISIIFLTAHMEDYNIDRAIAVDPVAYLSKPFNREELKAFVKIAEHKITDNTPKEKHIDGKVLSLDEEFTYHFDTETIYFYNQPLHLTKKESQLFKLLLYHRNSTVDLYTIENEIWPDKETSNNTVRTLVRRLREKLKHKFIKTLSTQGYTLEIRS